MRCSWTRTSATIPSSPSPHIWVDQFYRTWSSSPPSLSAALCSPECQRYDIDQIVWLWPKVFWFRCGRMFPQRSTSRSHRGSILSIHIKPKHKSSSRDWVLSRSPGTSTSMSEAMVHSKEIVDCSQGVGSQLLPKVKEYLRVWLTNLN